MVTIVNAKINGIYYSASDNNGLNFSGSTNLGDAEALANIKNNWNKYHGGYNTLLLNGSCIEGCSAPITTIEAAYTSTLTAKTTELQALVNTDIQNQYKAQVNFLVSDTAEWGSNAAYSGALNETNAEITAFNNALVNQPKANVSSSLQVQALSSAVGLSIKTLITVVVIITLLYMVMKK